MDSDDHAGEADAVKATRHCFVLRDGSEHGDLSRVADVVADVFGEGHFAEVSDSIVTVTRGGETVGFLAHIPAPIPNHEAEENADGNFLWPGGAGRGRAASLPRHRDERRR